MSSVIVNYLFVLQGDASGKPTLQAQDQFIEDIFDQLLAEMPAINKFLAGR